MLLIPAMIARALLIARGKPRLIPGLLRFTTLQAMVSPQLVTWRQERLPLPALMNEVPLVHREDSPVGKEHRRDFWAMLGLLFG